MNRLIEGINKLAGKGGKSSQDLAHILKISREMLLVWWKLSMRLRERQGTPLSAEILPRGSPQNLLAR